MSFAIPHEGLSEAGMIKVPLTSAIVSKHTEATKGMGLLVPTVDSKNEKSLIVGSTNSIYFRVLVIRLASWVPCTQLQKHKNFDLFCRPGGSDTDTILLPQDTADMWANSSCRRYRTEWFCYISNTCNNTVRSGGSLVNIRIKYICIIIINYYTKAWRLI